MRNGPAGLGHYLQRLVVIQQLDGVTCHGVHVGDIRQVPALPVLDQFRDASHPCGDRHDFTRHSLQSRQTERFQFARQQQDVGQGQLLLHQFLLAQKDHVVVNAFLYRQPFGARAVGAVADHQQLGGNLLAHPVKDLDAISNALDRTKIG